MTEFYKPLTEEEIKALRAEFALDDDDPLMEFFQETDAEDSEENPASRDNLYYAP